MKKFVLAFWMVAGLGILPISATVINVPADQSTIQAGINASTNGDTVLVAAGTYLEHLYFGGNNITLLSEAGAESTIIQKLTSGSSLLTINSGEDTTSIVDGFTFLDSYGKAAIYIANSGAKIMNCVFNNNFSDDPGGAIQGVHVTYTVICNNRFENNSAYRGGAVDIEDGEARISYNTFSGNVSETHGGAVYLRYSELSELDHNVFYENNAQALGGAICLSDCNDIAIFNNTIVYNSTNQSQYGAGISIWYSETCEVYRNIIAFNGPGKAVHCSDSIYVPNIHCTNIYGNDGADWTGYIADQANINGNFSLNPLFCHPDTNNFYLYDLSPCAAEINDCGVLIGAFDIGCEYINHTIYISTSGNDSTGNGTSENPFATIQKGIDVAVSGYTILIAPGTYSGDGNTELSINSNNITLMGDSEPSDVVIDANDVNNILTVEYGEYNIDISGITFANAAKAITLNSGRADISNCIFESNLYGTYGVYSNYMSFKKCQFIDNTITIKGTEMWEDYDVDSCTFIGNSICIDYYNDYLNSADLVSDGTTSISNSTFSDGNSAISGWCNLIEIDNCTFTNFASTVIGFHTGDLELSNVVFSNNNSTLINASGGNPNIGGVVIKNSEFTENSGGFEFDSYSSLYMYKCLYCRNSKGILYNSVSIENIQSVRIQSCTICDIDTTVLVYATQQQGISIGGCIIANNNGYGISILEGLYDASISIGNNNFFNNSFGNYDGIDDQTGISGNISEDPVFIGGDPFDYHLQLATPCPDMGVYPFNHGIPNIPTLIAPENDETIGYTSNLSWLRVPNPYQLDTVYYSVQIDDDSLFASIDVSADSVFGALTDTVLALLSDIDTSNSLSEDNQYYWRVNALNRFGDESDYTDFRNFYLNNDAIPPESFPLYTPEADLRRVDYYTYFNWGNTVDYDPNSSFDFTLQVSSDSLFDECVVTKSGITDTSIVIITDSLATGGANLYWRVFATDNDSLIQYGGVPEPEVRLLTIVPPGDVNGDGLVLGGDVTYLVNYFRGINPAPDPLMSGDVTGDCMVIGGDVTYLVSYFRGISPQLQRGDCESDQ